MACDRETGRLQLALLPRFFGGAHDRPGGIEALVRLRSHNGRGERRSSSPRPRLSGLGWIAVVLALAVGPVQAAEDGNCPKPQQLRFNDDYRVLADPARHCDFWDPVKYIRLSDYDDAFLSFGGEFRERFEHSAGGFRGRREGDVFMHRLLFHADVHANRYVRSFLQFGIHQISGFPTQTLPTDVNGLDVHQGFVDLSTGLYDDERLTLRSGRQEMTFGSGRLIATREGANVRLSFNGVRATYTSPQFDLDVFATRPDQLRPGTFDDGWDPDRALWGIYGVNRLLPALNVDLYLLGYDNRRARFAVGDGNESRRSVGTRLWGGLGAFDYNLEAVYQFGRFDALEIAAFAISGDFGWTFSDWPLSPRIGIRSDIESGDRDPGDNRLGTFNPMFPNFAYFSEAAVGAPMNDIDAQPNLSFQLTETVSLRLAYDMFWKAAARDAVYNAILQPIPGTRLTRDRAVGNLFTAHLKWNVDRHWEINFDYTHFEPSKSLQRNGLTAIDFAMASMAYRF